MSKYEEDKLANAIIALHQEIRGLRHDVDKQLARVNLGLGELRLSYIKLDESFNKYAKLNTNIVKNHETRIVRLEGKSSGGSYIVREPTIEYKNKKKK